MAAPRTSPLVRIAVNSIHLAVRHWPKSSRQWGQAVLAEIGEIDEPAAVVGWALGGIVLFFRALFSDFVAWLKLPAGGSLTDSSLSDGSGGPQFPRHSRWATAAVLLGTFSLFILPVGREARKTVSASWREFDSKRDRRELEKLGARAEKEGDARELAFVALNTTDLDRSAYFADRAIAIDPSLAWIYLTRFPRLENQGDKERLARLKSFDPDNAAVYLGAAQDKGSAILRRTPRGWASAKDERVEALINDREWLEEMKSAFRASGYDSYRTRRREIDREGWEKKPYLSPAITAHGVCWEFFPDIFEMRTYVDLRIREARQMAAAGRMDEATKIVGEVTSFGEHISKEHEAREFQQWIGLDLTRRGLDGLRQIYADSGHHEEAEAVASEIHKIEARTDELRRNAPKYHRQDWQASQRSAVLVHASSILVALLAVAILLSLCVLELSSSVSWWRTGTWKRFACRVADYGPVLFLGASLTLLVSFQPFANALRQYRSSNLSRIELRNSSTELEVLQDMSPISYFSESSHNYFLWLSVTLVLSAIAIIVLLRGLTRHRATVDF